VKSSFRHHYYLAYMPILLMTRVEGKLFFTHGVDAGLPLSAPCFARLPSFRIDLVCLQKIALHRGCYSGDKKPVLEFMTRGYQHTITAILNFPKSVVIAGGAVVITLILFGGN